jgi:hypothetical protein
MTILIFGFGLIGIAAILDSFLRVRMTRIGYKWALLEGGAFDYGKYHQERKRRGWSVWPVVLMWVSVISGIALLILGFFAIFGTGPTHPK